jgi:hypothetical protein
MKYYALLLSAIISPLSFAMKLPIEIRNRDLNALERPHITIINQLPTDNPYFSNTRIDISDKTKITAHDKYQPDESTVTIHPREGIRFSLYKNKTLEPEHRRLGLNDAEDAALIALYIHGAPNNPLNHLVIGKGSFIPFGDTVTITAQPDGAIIFNTETDMQSWKLEIISDPEDKKLVLIIGIPDQACIGLKDIIDSKKRDTLHSILKINYYLGRFLLSGVFLEENPYIDKLLCNFKNEEKKSEEELEKNWCIGSCLNNPGKNVVQEIIDRYTDDFNEYLQENPDIKDMYDKYPLDDDLDEQ